MDLADRLREAVADRYAVERELGRGGMAVVYLARDLRHERRVAIKVLRPELTVTLVADRFLREIQIAAQLQHPLIVPLHDSGGTDELLWYVMPFIEGETLRQRLQREGQLPLDDALQITRDAAAALQCAHEHGVVHRDIKPENILLSGGHAMLADFGIARALTRAAGEGTSSGVAIGTPAYMSPEQAAGGAVIDARSDIYSLGCVVYEMLAGEPPFTGPTPQSVIARHVSERPPSLRVVRPAVAPELEAAIEKALAKVPADRYAAVTAFETALAGAAARSPAPGRRPGGRARTVAAWVVGLLLIGAGASLIPRREPAARLNHAPRVLVERFASSGSETASVEAAASLYRTFVTELTWLAGLAAPGAVLIESPTSVGAAWGPGTLEAARRAGASYVVRGEVVGTADARRLSILLYPSSGEQAIAQAIGGEAGEALPAAAGRLALEIAAALGEHRGAAGAHVAHLLRGSRSPTAVRHLVDGRRHLYRQDSDAAVDAFRRALAADPSFAEAYFWLSMAETWAPRWDYGAALRVADSGIARRRSMVGRRALLIDAQRYYALRLADSAIAAFQVVVRNQPELIEGWFGLGESIFHLGGFAGHERAEARLAFERVLLADSTFAPVHAHLIELAFPQRDTALARRMLPFVARSDPDEQVYAAAVPLMLGSPQERAAQLEALAGTDFRTLSLLFLQAVVGGDLQLADTVTGLLLDPQRPLDDRRRGARYRLVSRAALGRWPEGLETWRRVAGDVPFDAWVVQSHLAGFPTGGLGSRFLERARTDVEGTSVNFRRPMTDALQQELQALVHVATIQGDSTTTARLLRRLRAAAPLADPSDPLPGALAASLSGRLALLAGDTARCIQELEVAVSRPADPYVANYPLTAMAPQRLLLAELHAARGETQRAQRWLNSFSQTYSIADVLYQRRIEELRRRLGGGR